LNVGAKLLKSNGNSKQTPFFNFTISKLLSFCNYSALFYAVSDLICNFADVNNGKAVDDKKRFIDDNDAPFV
jgi:hypothetical protein